MSDSAERKVSAFYNDVGWKSEKGVTEDACRWEDLRPAARRYVRGCRLRVLRHIPAAGENFLDMASGPIQYEEYLSYSKNFKKRYCVDLSPLALEEAKRRIGDHGVFLCGSWFDLKFQEDFFDSAVSLHTIYHMDKDRQEEAVRKLLYVTKPGKPVIIVYSNPHTLWRWARLPGRAVSKVAAPLATKREGGGSFLPYFFAHPRHWWRRFEDLAEVKILPWRSFGGKSQKLLVPDNRFGERLLDILFNLEDRFPSFFSRHFQFPMIILTKRKAAAGKT